MFRCLMSEFVDLVIATAIIKSYVDICEESDGCFNLARNLENMMRLV